MAANNQDNIITTLDLGKEITNNSGLRLIILEQINLEIKAGESVAILGPSGSGKSTLLSLLAGLDVPSHGQVYIHDQDLTLLDEDGRAQIRAQWVGFVFQSFHLLPHLTALENVMLPLELAGHSNSADQALAGLEQVQLTSRVNHYPSQLSGGEQQRVAIARAFVRQPTILFADEPTGNLDSRTGQQIIDLLFNLNAERQTTLVLVTHDRGLAGRCQRQLYLDQGQLGTEVPG
jgi:putative ABC transport system ATP-binding protein